MSLASSLSSTATGPSISSTNTSLSKLDLSPSSTDARKGALPDSFFSWNNDSRATDFETPEELQKKDPLGIQIWRLYSRTKTQLPNQERMDNLAWRMMSMNLRRQQAESVAQSVLSLARNTHRVKADDLPIDARSPRSVPHLRLVVSQSCARVIPSTVNNMLT